MRNISEYDKRVLTLLHAWAKLWKFWKKETFQEEVDSMHFNIVLSKIKCKKGNKINLIVLQHVTLASSMSKRRAML